jgi:redox-sensitive bicupin YhaK (pirin superfamily)
MKTVLHKANTRGHANHGWLNAHHTFSFGQYYDPSRIHFGALRVLNDDEIAGGMGFPTHPHDNMEIITIPLEGALEHRDSMGSAGVIRKNEVQVMSAGTGLQHSEANASPNELLRLLQIWVFPRAKDVKPRYQQIELKQEERKNRFQQIVSPNPADEGAWVQQDAWFHLGDLDAGTELEYRFKDEASGLYVFVIEGEVEVAGETLSRRDGLGITEAKAVTIKASADSEILLMEVPMS